MKEEIQQLSEMSDSRELLESKPNPIMPLFIYMLIGIIALALIWTYFGEIDEVVKANGVVRTDETIGTLRNQVPGQVEDIHFYEGQLVEEGDLLFTLDQRGALLQERLLQEDLEKVEVELADLITLRKSIIEDQDLFSTEDREDNKVYERYLAYKSNISLIEKDFTGSSIEINQSIDEQKKQKENLQSRREDTKKQIKQLERLEQAFKDKKNGFNSNESPYYNRYVDYELTINQIESTIAERKEAYEQAKAKKENEKEIEESTVKTPETADADLMELNEPIQSTLITQEQVDELKRLYEEAKVELKRYKNEQLLQVRNDMEQHNDQLKEIEANLKSGQNFSEIMGYQEESHQASVENTRADMMVHVNNDIRTIEQQGNQLRQELSTLKLQQEESIMKAPITGVVHVRTEISHGDFLQGGTEVLTIVPKTDASIYKIQLSVLNEDIAKTRVGDEINFRFHALPYQEFGQLHGEVTKISTDAINHPETGMSYYVVEASVKNEMLISHKGEESQIKVGMTTDAHIVAGSKKILHFLLEKIDLSD